MPDPEKPDRKVETIKLGKDGPNYAKVAARSAEFHRDNETCSIETSVEFKEGFALFTAKVTTKKGTFMGHSMEKVAGKQKQFEKQETIAVGRALAFAASRHALQNAASCRQGGSPQILHFVAFPTITRNGSTNLSKAVARSISSC